ncbi:MAG TPA: hypothetical protein VES89_10770 [Candidatus Competibacteraceae bacterium]|nr:hypothetical protein [Candidatus Competibacteraceae bacterium]
MNRLQRSHQTLPITSRPLAARGLKSYRYRLPHGFVMVGALNELDALKQAARSIDHSPQIGNLQHWNGLAYVPCEQPSLTAAN